ncbi:Serine/threonine-protein kinase H1 [Tulasnella sp. JGI-2019a]|nr:Serine/threonine-protein kinase H1 [Tulasnella sp. JGI-2019a]
MAAGSANSKELACKVVYSLGVPVRGPGLQLHWPKDRALYHRAKGIENELYIWKYFDHPGVMRLIDSFKEGDYKICFVVYYATLGSLFEYRLSRLDLDQKLSIVVQVMDGVIYLHDNEIIHRDLKPHNILLTGDCKAPIAMVTDFGISHKGLTHNSSSGTAEWMAPEAMNRGTYDNKVDAYGIGRILWWMLSNTPFFDDDQAWDEFRAQLPSGAVGSQIEDFLQRLLAPEPEERWTVTAARQHPLVRDIAPRTTTSSAVIAGESVAEDAALNNGDVLTSVAMPPPPPAVAATPVASGDIPLIQPIESALIAADLSVGIVETMRSSTSSVPEVSGTSSLALPLGVGPAKRKREVSASSPLAVVSGNGPSRTKRRKASPSANDTKGKRETV